MPILLTPKSSITAAINEVSRIQVSGSIRIFRPDFFMPSGRIAIYMPSCFLYTYWLYEVFFWKELFDCAQNQGKLRKDIPCESRNLSAIPVRGKKVAAATALLFSFTFAQIKKQLFQLSFFFSSQYLLLFSTWHHSHSDNLATKTNSISSSRNFS